jgi:hypothetical protein
MKTNVQPGMLAYIVAVPGIQVVIPEIIGRVVYVERHFDRNYVFKHIDGRMMRNNMYFPENTWIISAKEPLPARVSLPSQPVEIWLMHERPLLDACLRPLLDPNLGVSDEEVKELYSKKEEVKQRDRSLAELL